MRAAAVLGNAAKQLDRDKESRMNLRRFEEGRSLPGREVAKNGPSLSGDPSPGSRRWNANGRFNRSENLSVSAALSDGLDRRLLTLESSSQF